MLFITLVCLGFFFSLSKNLLMDIWVVLTFWPLQLMLP